ncbi:hypothetical protein [Yoonia sp. 208BN28-4]|uniref:hypothetical protein n=1 Tax=Yoonia sp. 208BN28-4 TaxID=3126505 RepID=UPI003097381C
MSDITALESRITSALDRIRAGVDKMSEAAAAVPEVDVSGLQTDLDEERMANAQLQERLRTLKERHDTALSELENKVTGQQGQMAAMETELQKLRQANADMRDINGKLRDAASEGVVEPELINRAMMAEIDALQAQRTSEAAAVDAILSEIKPLLKEG